MTSKLILSLLLIFNSISILTAQKTIYPPALRQGDTIAICSPAGAVDTFKVEGAVKVLTQQGWNVKVMPHALGQKGNYSGTADERLDDLRQALADPAVKAVLCSRGGYGVVHIIEQLDTIDLSTNPKWLIGFSDISALHALHTRQGVASLHSNMTGDIMKAGTDDPNATMFKILRGQRPDLVFQSDSTLDRPGTATGKLVGGNLAVLADLIATKYDVLSPGTILFIEDIGEPIYKIERILYQLRMTGVLPNLAGLIVGQFTEYHPDRSYETMEQMIRDMVADYQYPVAFNAPIGHVDYNMPVIENAPVTLTVGNGRTTLKYND